MLVVPLSCIHPGRLCPDGGNGRSHKRAFGVGAHVGDHHAGEGVTEPQRLVIDHPGPVLVVVLLLLCMQQQRQQVCRESHAIVVVIEQESVGA